MADPKNLAKTLKPFAMGFFAGAIILSLYRLSQNDRPPSWEEREAVTRKLTAQMAELARKIQSLQGHSHCLAQADCRVIGLGSSTCKGYKNFLIYSVQDADSGALTQAVDQFNEVSQKLNDLSLETSTCGEKAVDIHCVKERCVPVLPTPTPQPKNS